MRQWFEAAVAGPWASTGGHVDEITEVSDNRAVVGSVLTARGESSQIDTELHMWDVLSFADGKVIRRQGPYMTSEEALEAVGLRE